MPWHPDGAPARRWWVSAPAPRRSGSSVLPGTRTRSSDGCGWERSGNHVRSQQRVTALSCSPVRWFTCGDREVTWWRAGSARSSRPYLAWCGIPECGHDGGLRGGGLLGQHRQVAPLAPQPTRSGCSRGVRSVKTTYLSQIMPDARRDVVSSLRLKVTAFVWPAWIAPCAEVSHTVRVLSRVNRSTVAKPSTDPPKG